MPSTFQNQYPNDHSSSDGLRYSECRSGKCEGEETMWWLRPDRLVGSQQVTDFLSSNFLGKAIASHKAQRRDIITVTLETGKRRQYSTLCCKQMHLQSWNRKNIYKHTHTIEDMPLVARARLKATKKCHPYAWKYRLLSLVLYQKVFVKKYHLTEFVGMNLHA